MKATGIVRPIDPLGHIVLPKELRNHLHIKERDSLEIFMDGENIVLKKYEPCCMFCQSMDHLVSFHGKQVCAACIRELGNLPEK